MADTAHSGFLADTDHSGFLDKEEANVLVQELKKLLQPYMDTIAKMKIWKPPNVAKMFNKMWNELDENHDGKVCHQHPSFT